MLHIQLEILTNTANTAFRHVIPCVYFSGIYLAMICGVVCVKGEVGYIRVQPFLCYFVGFMAASVPFLGFVVLKSMESVREGSLRVLERIEIAVMRDAMSKIMRRSHGGESYYYNPVLVSGRLSRRPLEAKFGIFMTVKAGTAIEFLKAIMEGAVNGTFIVDLTYPSWYLRSVLYSNRRYESVHASCFKQRWLLALMLL